MAIVGGQEERLYITQQEVHVFLRLLLRLWEQEGWNVDPRARTRMCKEPEWRVSVRWMSGEQDPESGWGEKAPEMDAVDGRQALHSW